VNDFDFRQMTRPSFIPHVARLLFALVFCALAYGQEPDMPSMGVFAGAGLQYDVVNHGALQTGATFDLSRPNHWIGWSLEGGYAGSFSDFHAGSALFSANYLPSWHFRTLPNLYPFATAGYTQLFGTGPAANFGAGVDFQLRTKFAIRVEARDYLGFSPHQHNFAIRIGFRRYIWD
jgi:hypothetical protein